MTFLVAITATTMALSAQTFHITWNLDGGCANPMCATDKGELFNAFMTDAGATDFETLEYYMAQANPLSAPNICSKLTNAAPALSMPQWAWLKAYIEAAHTAQAADGASTLTADGTGAAWRYAVGAFFCSIQNTGWPKSADFTELGKDASYASAMNAAGQYYAYPTEVAADYVLPTPIKKNYTFLGWYNGENKVETISADITLTAKYEATDKALLGIALSKTGTVDLQMPNTDQLTVTFTPETAANKNVTWSSSDEKILVVDQTGLVTPKAPGKATVKVVSEESKLEASVEYNITAAVGAVTGVALNKTTLTLALDATEQLIAYIAPADANNKKVSWASDSKAVSVDENGLVKADTVGTATITVTTEDGGYTATCVVTVPEPLDDIVVEKLWEVAIPTTVAAISDCRNGYGWNGKFYLTDKNQNKVRVFTKNGEEVDAAIPMAEGANLGTGIAIDDAGNIVLAANFPSADTCVFIVKSGTKTMTKINFRLPQTGRCDQITAFGDIFSEQGGLVFFYVSGATKIQYVKIANGSLVEVKAMEGTVLAGTSPAQVLYGTETMAVANARGAEAMQIVKDGVVTDILPKNAITRDLGGAVFSVGENEVWAYEVGTVHSSEFSVRNMTTQQFAADKDGNTVHYFVDNKAAANNSYANFTKAEKINDYAYYLNVFTSGKGAAVYKVYKYMPVTGIVMTPETATLKTGEKLQLNAAVVPAYATVTDITFTSSKPEVATVTETGLVQALTAGEATITATSVEGNFTATCVVTVKPVTYKLATAVSELVAGKKMLIVNAAETYTLGAVGETGNDFTATAITPANHILTDVPADATIITLAKDNDNYTFAVDGGFLAAKAGASAALVINPAASALTTWTIAMNAEGVATITCTDATVEKNIIRYYEMSRGSRFENLFAAYAASETRYINDVVIYIEETPRPTEITYELNGGWTNDYGWQNKQDMYAGLNTLWNSFAKVPADYANYTWTSLDSCKGDVAKGIPSACYSPYTMKGDFFADAATKAKFQWLVDYMQYVCTLQKVESDFLEDNYGVFLRYNLQAFFLNAQRTAWPVSANYEVFGNIDAFQPYWKHGFDNPNKVDKPYTLQAPYREEVVDGMVVKYTFMGWYDNPNFEGEKIETIDENTVGTLYAKWTEYIATVADVKALTDGETTKMRGTTTYFDGTEAYLQDATGGMRVIFPTGTTLAENTNYLVKGTKSVVNGAPTLTVTEVIAQEATSPIVPIVVDQVKSLGDYAGKLIKLEGKRIAGYSASGDPVFCDDHNSIASYKLPIDQTIFYNRRKSDVMGVVENWNGALRIRAFVKNVTPSAPAGRDEHKYEAIASGKAQNGKAINYYLSNDWMYSNVLGNFASNRSNDVALSSRGMVLHNGFLYFPNRDANQPTYVNFKKVNIKDGDMFDAIPAADYLFRTRGIAGRDFVFGSANDLKKDNAGHVLAANLITSAKGEYQIWVMDDIDHGKGYLLICDTTLNDDFANNAIIRFDAFGVNGDVTKDALIMAASASTGDVYYWNIQDGKWNGNHSCIKTKGGHNFGFAPQIFPIGDDIFYVDGSNDYPILFDMGGNDMDWFDVTDEGGMKPLVTNRNGEIRKTGNNGLIEFELGGEHFLVMAGGNKDDNPASTFVLYKYADEERVFADMTQMWEFPYDGMGNVEAAGRAATISVQVVNDKTAKIAVYTAEDGYGVYTFSVATSDPSVPGTLSVRSANEAMGSATGSGTYPKGEIVSISATANNGYRFVQWQDGNTDNPRQVEITEDEASYIAIFAKNTYGITTYATNGSITGNTYGVYMEDIVLTAVPDYGYHFTQWGDGNTDNPRIIRLTQDTTLIALFAANRYTVTTNANVSDWGTTDGDAVVTYRDWVTISATANYGYHFEQWQDGNTDTPRQIQVTADANYTANFAKNYYFIYAAADNGTIIGGGSGRYLDEMTLTVVPNTGYHFVQWSDGNTDNPRTILLTQDITLTALCMQASSGKCGDNLYWNYTDGTLSITGFGAMYDFTDSSMPWVSYCSSISSVTFEEGMTSVGNYAFYGCGSLTSVEMPNSVTTMGTNAFAMCTALGKVVIGSGIVQIGEKAFYGCRKLLEVYCHAVNPPLAETSSFMNYNAHLYVPCSNQEAYETDMVFGSFKFIECLTDIGTDNATIHTEDEPSARKIFRNGQVLILREGKTYTTTGIEIR